MPYLAAGGQGGKPNHTRLIAPKGACMDEADDVQTDRHKGRRNADAEPEPAEQPRWPRGFREGQPQLFFRVHQIHNNVTGIRQEAAGDRAAG